MVGNMYHKFPHTNSNVTLVIRPKILTKTIFLISRLIHFSNDKDVMFAL